MNCDELRDHYELYALGVAEEPEHAEIRSHLNRECATCVAGVKQAVETVEMLGATAVPQQPSPGLRRRILASVGAEQRRFSWAPVWAGAAALSLAAGTYLGIQENRYAAETAQLHSELRAQSSEITRLTDAFAILNGPDTREAAFGQGRPQPPRGKVFLNPRQGVLLMASNLPPTPPGKLYEMWVIPRTGRPLPAGLFQSQNDGSAMHVRKGAVDVESTGAVAVTIENESGADQPTSQPLIVAPLASPQ